MQTFSWTAYQQNNEAGWTGLAGAMTPVAPVAEKVQATAGLPGDCRGSGDGGQRMRGTGKGFPTVAQI